MQYKTNDLALCHISIWKTIVNNYEPHVPAGVVVSGDKFLFVSHSNVFISISCICIRARCNNINKIVLITCHFISTCFLQL